jgi:hypothetical protein
MNIFRLGQQAERVGMTPTLPVVLAKGIALEQVVNQNPRYVRKEYAYNESYSLIYFFLNHVIQSLFPCPPDWRSCYILPQEESINKEENQFA